MKKDKKGILYTIVARAVWIFSALFFRCEIRGAENLPARGQKVLVCSNHISALDPVFVAVACIKRRLCFMGKAELFRNPVIAYFFRKCGAFPVERGTGGADALAEARRLLEDEGRAVTIFIEGTRSKTGELLKPKMGAAVLANQTQTSILPVCITTKDCLSPKFFNRVVVTFGELIQPEEFGIETGSGVELRRLSRMIMDRIAAMREEDKKKF
ncbi:MAG: 1-acyl-sn-glycerol-3-phosphate acyltransferase [Clostridia bacterium]|nr:1-acyl-sn-glycerol-3-phosphate acyltransferase [Clostridia bacterium]